MALGDRFRDRTIGRHLAEVAPRLEKDFSDIDLQVVRGSRRRLHLEGVIDGLPFVYEFIGDGDSGGGTWQISIQGSPIESLHDLLRASVVKKRARWVEKRTGQQRVIPARALRATAAWVLGGDGSVLMVTAKNPEAIDTLVASGTADRLLSVPPNAQYFASGRLDAQLPMRWWGRHPVEVVSARIRACVDAMRRLPT